jgi:hypothetical protein
MASQWNKLLDMAIELIDQVNRDYQIIDHWTLGGGTAMMLRIDHRESHDVDIFLDDHQLLPYLDLAKQDFTFAIAPSDYRSDGSGFQKIAFDGIGEIDFIVCASLTDKPASRQSVKGREVLIETIPEIICKKVFYRGAQIRPRDIFDIAAACRTQRRQVVAALSHHKPKVEQAIAQIINSDRHYIDAVIADLQIKPGYANLKSDATAFALEALNEALV